MRHKKLLFALVVLAAVIVGLLAGIIEYADEGQMVGAVKYGGSAFGGAMVVGLMTVAWLKPS